MKRHYPIEAELNWMPVVSNSPFSSSVVSSNHTEEVIATMLCEDSEEPDMLNDLLIECEDLIALDAACCFIRRDLNSVLGYFEATLPLV